MLRYVWLIVFAGCAGESDHIGATIERVHDVLGDGADVVAEVTPDTRDEIDDGGEVDGGGEVAPETVDSHVADTQVADTRVDTVDDVETITQPDVPDPDLPDLAHPDPELPTLSADALAAVARDMSAALNVPGLAGRSFGGLVVDLETDQVVWALDPDKLLIPASNTKVFTTAAAIELLGPDHRMLTRVFGAISDGVAATLDLHGEHDFTWSHWFYDDPRHPADRIADALYGAGLRRVTGDVGVWGAFLYEGHHFGTYDPATHRTRAGNAFIAALRARGITVGGALVDHPTMALPPGGELTRWESIPLHVGAWAILRKSHNEMADILARHLGYFEKGSSDYVAGGAVMAEWLASVGDATGFTLSDGSGLALANRTSARHIVTAYAAMARSSNWEWWRRALSIGGAQGAASTDANDVAIVTTNTSPYNGTLAFRMSGADTAGRVFGKSGTNAGITTSGVLYNRHDGRRYAYAYLMNNLPSGTADLARVTQDALTAVVAKDIAARGVRPAAPTLGCVRARDGVVTVDVSGQDIALETSLDGVVWDRREALFKAQPPFQIVAPQSVLYVRARAESAAGISDPSDVYAVRDGDLRVLLVDANDRWQRQPTNENVMGAAHDFMAAYAAAIPDGVGFDTCPNELLSNLVAYDAIVWATGEEATTDESISASEQAALADYLEGAGALFVSGAEVAWDLDPMGNSAATAADRTFSSTWLRASYVGDDAESFVVEGSGVFAGRTHNERLGFYTPGQIFVAYPDVLGPLGEACLSYVGSSAVAAACSAQPAVVTFGFPFESIDTAADRAWVMGRVLAHFGLTP